MNRVGPDHIEHMTKLLAWAYGKLRHLHFTKLDDSLALDEIKLAISDTACNFGDRYDQGYNAALYDAATICESEARQWATIISAHPMRDAAQDCAHLIRKMAIIDDEYVPIGKIGDYFHE